MHFSFRVFRRSRYGLEILNILYVNVDGLTQFEIQILNKIWEQNWNKNGLYGQIAQNDFYNLWEWRFNKRPTHVKSLHQST